MLCDAGADVNYYCSRGENGVPPIIYASENGNHECVQMLWDAGADANIMPDGSDETAMATAKKGGHTAIAAMLKENGAKG